MFNMLIKGKVQYIGNSTTICYYDSQYYLCFQLDDSNTPIRLILDNNDNKEEAINILTEIKDWLNNENDGDIIFYTDKNNQEHRIIIEKTLFTKRVWFKASQDTYLSVTRQMLNKAIRILKSW